MPKFVIEREIAAPNEQMIRDHAAKGGFPANRISEVRGQLDPTSAER